MRRQGLQGFIQIFGGRHIIAALQARHHHLGVYRVPGGHLVELRAQTNHSEAIPDGDERPDITLLGLIVAARGESFLPQGDGRLMKGYPELRGIDVVGLILHHRAHGLLAFQAEAERPILVLEEPADEGTDGGPSLIRVAGETEFAIVTGAARDLGVQMHPGWINVSIGETAALGNFAGFFE